VDLAGSTRTVSYNGANLITAYTHSGTAAQWNQSFGYDLADRLTSFTRQGVTTTYGYDANGNRVVQSGGSFTISGSSNELQGATVPARSFSYDSAGNRIGDGRFTYSYSDRGRLAHVGGATSLDMLYNGLGQRVAKVGMTPTYYAYDEAGHTIGTYQALGVSSMETVYLGDVPVAVITPTMALYLLADHLNAPLALARAPVGQANSSTSGRVKFPHPMSA
jgi:YD repeat-containing protein